MWCPQKLSVSSGVPTGWLIPLFQQQSTVGKGSLEQEEEEEEEEEVYPMTIQQLLISWLQYQSFQEDYH